MLLLCSEAEGPVTGDDAMDWITAVVLVGMALARVTVHAMTGGSVAVGLRQDIPFRSGKATMVRRPLT